MENFRGMVPCLSCGDPVWPEKPVCDKCEALGFVTKAPEPEPEPAPETPAETPATASEQKQEEAPAEAPAVIRPPRKRSGGKSGKATT